MPPPRRTASPDRQVTRKGRLPTAPQLAAALRDRRLTCIGWSARGLERWHKDPESVATQVLRFVRPGAILLLHEGPSVPAAITPARFTASVS